MDSCGVALRSVVDYFGMVYTDRVFPCGFHGDTLTLRVHLLRTLLLCRCTGICKFSTCRCGSKSTALGNI